MIQCVDLWMATDKQQQHTVNILMEYCSGGDLYQYIKKAKSAIPEAEIVRLMSTVLVPCTMDSAINPRPFVVANVYVTLV
jgi:hypothetical protein